MSTRTKNPLHPSALSLNDIRVGRRIIRFNRHFGVTYEGVVATEPYLDTYEAYDGRERRQLVVNVRCRYGIQRFYLSDMGVIPYSGSNSNPYAYWNNTNFVVDVRKRALLPDTPPKSSHIFDSFIYGDPYVDEVGYY